MPQIWDDVQGAMTNMTVSNNQGILRFRWAFVTFSGEAPVEVWLRWRKADTKPDGSGLSLRDRIRRDEGQWQGYETLMTKVYRLEDRTTWVLSGGQLVPPADNLRRYSYTHHVDFPTGKFSDGFYIFQASIKAFTDGAGVLTTLTDAEQGWTTHRLEINQFDDVQEFTGSSTGQVKGPGFDREGVYAVKVEVMSEAGITGESAEVQFNVWDTNKYLKNADGSLPAVPENFHTGTQPVRVRRTTT